LKNKPMIRFQLRVWWTFLYSRLTGRWTRRSSRGALRSRERQRYDGQPWWNRYRNVDNQKSW
jgi:hypothetical protein